jgi:F0F1-type ATP synthase membrane subunit b/b'
LPAPSFGRFLDSKGESTVSIAGAERETLERLRGDEADLEQLVSAARDGAATIVESARREAEGIAARTRVEAERDVERLRAGVAEEIDGALVAAREATASRAAELRRRAAANRERAVARAIAAALGPHG